MMNRPVRIVFLDRETLPPQIVLRRPDFPHEIEIHQSTAADEIAPRIREADVVITNKVPVRGAALEGAANVRLIAIAATGYDVVDTEMCQARGIVVSNIRDYAVNTVPEHTFALILSLKRSLPAYRPSVAAGDWQKSGQFCYFAGPMNDLAGSTIGIMGDGALGKSVARLAEAFGMTVLFAAYKGTTTMGPLYTPFEEVLERADVITLHCPLLPSTRNMIGAAEFARMTRRPIVINTARGGLVDEAALVEALKAGRIGGAGFDVVTTEPPPEDHPFMQILDRPDFILTPHVAWGSTEAIQTLADQLIDNVEAWHRGTPTNLVV
ncbi:D-2-hydroxyacid dehydrogenase [Acuticoccus sp. I52.16.1]|uniref:D-2-hydroxyacid dehydrogenase n=1 Tax=Acuticoccus sp. I52.16.1 TaxID=2928472 RepID=UPI001FD4118A|nr:D-2-hydroxyacid dehydrogenase [Acuticoccus sp. I52.16.1]UOM34455.1 D-2-hydroxyacid dehydrogenase [Acuticoccus sp. I52.16.1]